MIGEIRKATVCPRVVLNLQRDVPLLHFLWRWKVSTTSALAAKFYPTVAPATAYRRLWRLEQGGYIRSRSDEAESFHLWTLDKRGFAVVKPRLPKMREEGYLSENPEHDATVSAVHLGEGLLRNLDGIDFFTEQELRRLDPNDFPAWMPQHLYYRSDGFWHLTTGGDPRVVMLEVELSPKGDIDYEMVGRYYEDRTEIERVVWVVDGIQFARKIHRLTNKGRHEHTKHSFIELKDFCGQGWRAKVSLGFESGKSLAEILINCPTTDSQAVVTQLLLDGRKSPHKSRYCRIIGAPNFSH